MAVIRDVDGKWSRNLTSFDLPLEKGLRLVIDPTVLDRDTATPCRLIDWQYRVANRQPGDTDVTANVELIVEELRPGLWQSWFARWSPDAQFLAPMITAGLSIFLAAAVGHTFYLQPDIGWAFAGRHVRTIGGWAVFLLFAALLPWKLGLYSGRPTFRKPFFSSFLTLTALVLVVVWQTFAALPQNFGGADADYAAYARALAGKLGKSYWPFLVAALPWLSVGFKLFGLDIADKTAEGIEKAAGKEK